MLPFAKSQNFTGTRYRTYCERRPTEIKDEPALPKLQRLRGEAGAHMDLFPFTHKTTKVTSEVR